jgi:serine/threonine protein phosphatase PrpC
MNIHSVSLRGKRNQNEDTHNIILNLKKNNDNANVNMFAVYDGHGGKYVSKCLVKTMPEIFMKKNMSFPLSEKTINNIYKHIQSSFKRKWLKLTNYCGSTCLIVFQYKKKNDNYIQVLNTGDSRCVMCQNNFAVALTKDHKPNWPEEKSRIEALGGEIYRDYGDDWRIGDLSVSRAFGDVNAEPYVTNIPDVFNHRLTKNDKFIVIGCDGLWDVLCNQEVINFVLTYAYDVNTGMKNKEMSELNISRKLAEYAIKKGSTDNVTVIIVFF